MTFGQVSLAESPSAHSHTSYNLRQNYNLSMGEENKNNNSKIDYN